MVVGVRGKKNSKREPSCVDTIFIGTGEFLERKEEETDKENHLVWTLYLNEKKKKGKENHLVWTLYLDGREKNSKENHLVWTLYP